MSQGPSHRLAYIIYFTVECRDVAPFAWLAAHFHLRFPIYEELLTYSEILIILSIDTDYLVLCQLPNEWCLFQIALTLPPDLQDVMAISSFENRVHHQLI